MLAYPLVKIAQAMCTNRSCFIDHFGIALLAAVRSSDADVISLDAKIFETFLNCNANCATAAPQADEKIGPEFRFVNVRSQLK